ncbi:HlyD family efflux transporter periplasmic adaptor subunit [Pedobacter psychrodurus]|uniref:HlyD family efflux transporter periplasmic adaptor subunit n=1 Tax=Pedobacter psychrodurus TaxID=2530456 RepID=UPI00292E9D21|nr:HlyD family efflux transporter periplasmic adaptor subunit [Pedobacter psychrodurus]
MEQIKASQTATKPKRTEEIQHIIDRMPTKFGFWITYLVLFMLGALLVFGWVVKYHDVALGVITINTANAPIKLIANTSGRVKLLHKTNDNINRDEVVAYVQNPADLEDVMAIKQITDTFKISGENSLRKLKSHLFSHKFTLGELSSRYFQFLSSLNHLANYHKDQIYIKQEQSLKRILAEYTHKLNSVLSKNLHNSKNASFYKRFSQRDSVLLAKKVISEAEFNRSELSYIASLSAKETSDFEHSGILQEIERTNNSLQQLSIEKEDKFIQLRLELESASSALKDDIKIWEERYLFKSPFKGRLQFLKFWVDNQFLHAGENVFTVVSEDNQSYGQVNLPIQGSGRVMIGQDVVIKLDNYPYMEYGSLVGKVKGISLTTHIESTSNGDAESYMVNVALPKHLVTNYGRTLEKTHEIKGTAEIITKERRLIQRIFDNLKYLIQNK